MDFKCPLEATCSRRFYFSASSSISPELFSTAKRSVVSGFRTLRHKFYAVFSLLSILNAAGRPCFLIKALNASYDHKDDLRLRKYKWKSRTNRDGGYWWKVVEESQLGDETDFVRETATERLS